MPCRASKVFRWISSACCSRVLFLLNRIKFSTRRVHALTREEWRAIEGASLPSAGLVAQMLLAELTKGFGTLKAINKPAKHCVQAERRNNLPEDISCSCPRTSRIGIPPGHEHTPGLVPPTTSWYNGGNSPSSAGQQAGARRVFPQSWLEDEGPWW